MSKIGYGLNLRLPSQQKKKQQQQQQSTKLPRPPAFGFNDDDEDDVESDISRQSSKNKYLKDTEEQQKKALKEDPTVFYYDGVYDDMKLKAIQPQVQDHQDRMDHEWRQAVTAAGSGCVAALSVERYLVSKDLLIEFHQPQTEEVKKELTDRDVQAGFDITLTKHKGEVIDEFDQNVHFVEIDIEEDPEIAEVAGIMGTPCVQFLKNKEMLRTVSGVKMKREYKEFIEENK